MKKQSTWTDRELYTKLTELSFKFYILEKGKKRIPLKLRHQYSFIEGQLYDRGFTI